jgi:hypothetical protein
MRRLDWETVDRPPDPAEVPGAAPERRAVHEVMRHEGGPAARRAEVPHPAQNCPPARRADDAGKPPARTAGREERKPGDVGEAGPDRPGS